MAGTLLTLTRKLPCNDQTKRLLLSLSLCLGEWCMNVPTSLLQRPWPPNGQPAPSKPLLHTVLAVLQQVATGVDDPIAQVGLFYFCFVDSSTSHPFGF